MPPGYNFFAIEIAQIPEGYRKQFTTVFMIRKRKKATMAERKELTVEEKEKETVSMTESH